MSCAFVVELRVRQRDGARLRDAARRRVRIAHVGHVRNLCERGDEFARPVARPLASCIDGVPCMTTCTASPGLRLEVRGQQVRCARRLGVGRAEVRREVGPEHRREHVDPDERQTQSSDDEASPSVTEAGEGARATSMRGLREKVRNPDYTGNVTDDGERRTGRPVGTGRKGRRRPAAVRASGQRGLTHDRRPRPRRALPAGPRRRHRGRPRALPADHEAIRVRGRRPARAERHRATVAAST